MYQPRHFDPCEFLPGLDLGTTWATLAPEKRALLSDRLLECCDDIRDALEVPCWINDYAIGGTRQYWGYRPADCVVGNPKSFKRTGQGVNIHAEGLTADEAREVIKVALAAGKLPLLGGMQRGVPWLDIDVRPRVDGAAVEFDDWMFE